jgi:type I restriction enzyme M protein
LFDKLQTYQYADPEDRDEYAAANVFWVPIDARWTMLQQNAKSPEIGILIDKAMATIERDNPTLKGVLPWDYGRADLDKRHLGELIDLIGTIALGDKESRSQDLLGRVEGNSDSLYYKIKNICRSARSCSILRLTRYGLCSQSGNIM